MDERLLDRLSKINEQIDQLAVEEERYLALKAHEDALYSILFIKAQGNNEQRKAEVLASSEWQAFQQGYVASQVLYQKARRQYELKLKAYDAAHLSFKNEYPAIKRQL